MITERTLRKWRAFALSLKKEHDNHVDPSADDIIRKLADSVLKLTQELLDQYLIGRGQ